MFESGTLNPDDEDAITNFSAKFIVERKLVKDYLQHLKTIEQTKSKQSKDREMERKKRNRDRGVGGQGGHIPLQYF